MRIFVVLLALALGGCGSVDGARCRIGEMLDNCAPGTNGYEATAAVDRARYAQDYADDAQCQAFGAAPDKVEYTQCRDALVRQRQAGLATFLALYGPQASSRRPN